MICKPLACLRSLAGQLKTGEVTYSFKQTRNDLAFFHLDRGSRHLEPFARCRPFLLVRLVPSGGNLGSKRQMTYWQENGATLFIF